MKRRQFMIRSSLATAALTTSNLALGHVFKNSANEYLNIGIVGTGNRGSKLISYINDIPNLNIVACCDIIPSRLERAFELLENSPTTHKDYRKLLEQDGIDAIIVATTFNSHSKITLDAIASGKHIYCESTIAKGYDGISNLLGAVNGTNTIIQTGHQLRSSKLFTHVKGLIENGTIGEITAFECIWNINGDWRIPVSEKGLERLMNWRMYREFSGGLTAELCTHQIDFVNWILNAVPEKVVGVGGNNYYMDDREIFDNVQLQYTYPNNIPAKFTGSTSPTKETFEIKVIGDKGTLILDFENAWFYSEGKRTSINVPHIDPSIQALINFKNNVIEKKMPISNVQTAAKTAIAVQMGIDALLNKQTIYWQSKLGV